MAIGDITWNTGAAVTISGVGSTSRTFIVQVTGLTVGRYYTVQLVGKSSYTSIGSRAKYYANSSTMLLTVYCTDSQLLTGLNNAERSGTTGLKPVYRPLVVEYIGDPDSGGSLQVSEYGPDGIATITPRTTAGTCSDFNLDLTGDTVQATWTRPSTHSGWRTRVEFDVNDIECILRYNYQGSMSAYTPSAGELDDMLAAMGGSSPGVIKARIYTGWTFYNNSYIYDTSSGSTTTTNSIIKSFAAAIGYVWLKVSGVMQKCEVYIKDTVMKRVHPYVKDTTWKESN